MGTEGDLPGKTVLQPSTIPVCHHYPPQREAGLKTAHSSCCAPSCKTPAGSAPTPLSLICFAICSFLWCYSSSPSPKHTEINPPECTAQTNLLQGLQGVWPREHGQGCKPAKTPMCQTEPFLALHHTLSLFKASLTVGKVSHYEALPPADRPIQQKPLWGGWQRGDHPSYLPLLCQHLERALGWCRCTENPTQSMLAIDSYQMAAAFHY